jgi:hypothetical protein
MWLDVQRVATGRLKARRTAVRTAVRGAIRKISVVSSGVVRLRGEAQGW